MTGALFHISNEEKRDIYPPLRMSGMDKNRFKSSIDY